MSTEGLTLQEVQKRIKALTTERGWDEKSLSEVYLLFVEEVGELAKEIRKHEKLEIDHSKAHEGSAAGELADVLIILADIANKLGVDLEEAFNQKMAITAKREWS